MILKTLGEKRNIYRDTRGKHLRKEWSKRDSKVHLDNLNYTVFTCGEPSDFEQERQ